MYRVLLATSLLRLGEVPPRIAVENYTAHDFEGFFFFIAGLLTAYENPLLYRMASWRVIPHVLDLRGPLLDTAGRV